MKNRIAKKVCAAALAGLMTMALVPTSVFAAGTMTIGVTSFADTLEPTEPVSYTHLDVYKRQEYLCTVRLQPSENILRAAELGN